MRSEDQKAIEVHARLVRAAEALDNLANRSFMMEGLTPSQFSTLRALRIEGPLAQRDIARHLLKSGGNITMVVDNLEREGFVMRERDRDDRRVVYVTLTQKGEDVFDRLYPLHLERIQMLMARLAPSEREHLASLLAKLWPDDVNVGRLSATMADPK